MHRRSGYIQVYVEAARPARRQMAGGPPEYQDGAPGMELVRKSTVEGGGGSFSVRNILSGSGAGGVTLRGRELGAVFENGQYTGGGPHGFFRKMAGKMARQQWDQTWRRTTVDSFLKEAGTERLGTYIDKRQTTVSEWVAFRLIYEVCDRNKG